MKRFFVVSMLVTTMIFSLFDTAALAQSSGKKQTIKPTTKATSKTASKKTTKSSAKAKSKSTSKTASKSKSKTTAKSKTKTTAKSKTKTTAKSKTKTTAKSKTKTTAKSKTKTTAKSKTKTTAKSKPKAAAKSKSVASRGGNETFNASKIIDYGLTLKGTRYKYGGTSPSGFDCSGFTSYVFKNAAGITLPHSSGGQAKMGSAVAKEDLQPGDIVYFNTNGRGVSHVGIYMGDNKFIHASSSKGITVTSLSDSYYVKRYMGARRIR